MRGHHRFPSSSPGVWLSLSVWLVLAISSLVSAFGRVSAALPWNMQETAMTDEGRLTFLNRPWWPRASSLAEGESFTLDLNKDGRPDTLVIRKDGNIVETINDSGGTPRPEDRVNAAHLVSFKGTGIVDRMVIYIDNDSDGKADEMELRHYKDGYLRYAWFGENYDGDGLQIFSLKNWSYAGNNASSKFRGNGQIYINKYESATKTWVPLSECPFAFWDYNRDGHGDTVLRVSAAPLASLTGSDTDYANNYDYMWSPRTTPLEDTGNVNVRFSFNIDPQPRHDAFYMPHCNFGFTMVGAVPYKYPKMYYTNPRRRPPQRVVRVDWTEGMSVGMDYPARETGFTWDESRSVWRWEGQFWTYERIFLPNTGGPTHRWNMRREYSATPSSRRRIYYSDADKRYHLLGAREGWMEAGHLVNQQKDLEFRWRDLDGDGYLDECQVFDAAHTGPVRVSRFAPRAREVPLDRDTLIHEYNERILPRAIEEDKALIAALKQIANHPLADAYIAEAQKAEMPERQRYCLDIARELYYLQVRNLLYDQLASNRYVTAERSHAYRSLEPSSTDGGYNLGDSLLYWKLAKSIELFTGHYGAGEFSEFLNDLPRIKRGAEMAPWTP